MTEITTKTQNGRTLAPAKRPQPIYPTDVQSAWSLSQYISLSGMAPKGYEKPEAVFTAIQMGAEIGLSPMASVQNIAVINNRPTIWGDAMLGLVRGSGLLEDFEERYEGEEGSDSYKAICVAKRDGYSNPSVGEFSIADAKAAGLWGKSGPWTTNYKRMLKMRARSFALRDGFTDILKGLYATEELQGTQPIENITPTASAKELNDKYVAIPGNVEVMDNEAEDVVADNTTPESSSVKTESPSPEKDQDSSPKAVRMMNLIGFLEKTPDEERAAVFVRYEGQMLFEETGRNKKTAAALKELGIYVLEGEADDVK